MENPYESPETPLNERGESNSPWETVTGILYGVFGFFAAGVTTSMLSTMLFMLLGILPGYTGAIIGAASPVVVGPLVGIGLWLLTRDRVRAFGRGALVFSVTSFLASGSCLLLMVG